MKTRLDIELETLLSGAFSDDQKSIDAMMLCNGFSGEAPLSHADAGHSLGMRYSRHGTQPYTRQAVSLLLDKAEQTLINYVASNKVNLPALESAIQVLYAIAPCSRSGATIAMHNVGLCSESKPFDPLAITRLARLFSLPIQVQMDKFNDHWFVIRTKEDVVTFEADSKGKLKQAYVPEAVARVATKLVVSQGAAQATELLGMIKTPQHLAGNQDALKQVHANQLEFVRSVIQTSPGCTWLDPDRNWFFFNRPSRNRLVTKIQQLFAVVNRRLPLNEFRHSIERCFNQRQHTTVFSMPIDILVNIAELVADCRVVTVNGEQFIKSNSTKSLEDSVGQDLMHIANFLRDNPMSSESEIMGYLIANNEAMTDPALSQRIQFSPFIRKDEHGRFSLRGTPRPTAAKVEPGIRPADDELVKFQSRTM